MAAPIRLYWYSSDRVERVNFGDDLSPVLVERLSGRRVVSAPPHMADLVAIGSVLQHLGRNLRKPRCWVERVREGRLGRIHVWGTGTFGPSDLPPRALVTVHAVRGPNTRAAMGLDDRVALGDPGLLVDRFDLPRQPQVRWGIVPHVDDFRQPGVAIAQAALPGARVIDLTRPEVPATLAAIRSCDFVLSSSLHGLIAADAFGIPNLWLSLSEKFYGGAWKFHDYFASVERTVAAPLVLRAGTLPPVQAELEALAAAAERATVSRRQAGLLAAFKAMNL